MSPDVPPPGGYGCTWAGAASNTQPSPPRVTRIPAYLTQVMDRWGQPRRLGLSVSFFRAEGTVDGDHPSFDELPGVRYPKTLFPERGY